MKCFRCVLCSLSQMPRTSRIETQRRKRSSAYTHSAGMAGQPNGAWMLTRSVVCVGVGVCVPKCTPSTGLAGQPNRAWMAAARCLDSTISVVCVGVGVCAGLAGQPNGAWMLVAVSGRGRRVPPRTPPPRDALQCALAGVRHSVR